MTDKILKILLVEDNTGDARFVKETLTDIKDQQFELIHFKFLNPALELLANTYFDIILLDLSLPDESGINTLNRTHSAAPNIPIIVLTGFDDHELALKALQKGAQDYLVKDNLESDLLSRSIRYAIERARILAEQKKLEEKQSQLVTELKKANIELKELNEIKSNFVSMVSHEFRTPLTVILAASNILKSYNERMTDEQKISRLDKIQKEIKYMTQLLNDVLIIGSVESGNFFFKPDILDLKKLCREIIEEVTITDDSKPKVIFSCTGEIRKVNMSEKIIRHIVMNLLSNAIKYNHVDSNVYFDLIYGTDEVIFCFKDEGIGIIEEDMEKLFEPFYRSSNVGDIHGTGLGLTIVDKAVKAHNGSIKVYNNTGAGTTFKVTIPINLN